MQLWKLFIAGMTLGVVNLAQAKSNGPGSRASDDCDICKISHTEQWCKDNRLCPST